MIPVSASTRERRVRTDRRRHLLAAIFCAQLLCGASAHAQVRDRNVPWSTIESEHFAVHYPAPLGRIARHAATVAEDSHRRLSSILDHDVQSRVQVVMRDNSDSANGSATSLPFNQMSLFVTSPADLTPLGDYDDWLHMLIIHEHTHVLHLDTISGLPSVVNHVLGKVLAPNLVQPRWFVEGLAVHEESRESTAGRLRSSMFEMYLRMDALEDRLLRLDQISSVVDRWPRGTSWYLYGSRFVDWIADRFGREALTAISHEYSRRIIPYAVNRAARRVTGSTFVELYDLFLEDMREQHRATLAEVEESGRIEGTRLTTHGEFTRAPIYLDEQRIAYWTFDGRNDSQLRELDLESGAQEQIARTAGESYASPFPGGILYESVDTDRDILNYSDLFWKRNDGEVLRLTEGRRARYPDMHPNGRELVFTVNGAGTTHLAHASLSDVEGTTEILYRSERYEQVYTPRYSPDGETIAVSLWRPGGYRDLALLDAQSGEVRHRITEDRAIDSGPAWSPDGRFLYFSSDRSGIANIYRFELATEEIRQVTNVIAGAYSPAISPGGEEMIYLGYTSYGFDLYRLDLREVETRIPAPTSVVRDEYESIEDEVHFAERYQAWPTLLPRGYLLDFGQDGFGTEIGVNIAGEDIVGFHSYSARISLSVPRGFVNADVRWTFARSAMPVSVRAFRRVSRRTDLEIGGESRSWAENAIGAELSVRRTFPRSFHRDSVYFGYSLSHLSAAEPLPDEFDPNTPPPRFPELGRLATINAGWSYSDTRRHTYDMSPSEGRSFSFDLRLSHEAIGSQFRAVRLASAWTRYLEAPWAQHHVFAMRVGAGISGGDLGRSANFSVGGFGAGIDGNLFGNLLSQSHRGGIGLRGYAPNHRVGKRFFLSQLEYRFPLGRIMWGPETIPVFLKRAHASVFVDVGDAWFGNFAAENIRVGAGAEVFLTATLGYLLDVHFRLGFAYGFMDDAGPQFYLHLGLPF